MKKILLLAFVLMLLSLPRLVSELPTPVVAISAEIVVPDDHEKIQWAINNASDGDTIFVRAGTYHECVIVEKSLKLIGEGPDDTIIKDPDELIGLCIFSDNVLVTGFTVQNSGYGVCLDNNNNTITGNIITLNEYGIYLFIHSNSNTISNNTIIGNERGIYLDNHSKGNTISNNNITLNEVGVITSSSNDNTFVENSISSNGKGVLISHSHNTTVSSNSISNNLDGISIVTSVNCTIVNNVISHNDNGMFLSDCSNNTIIENILSNNINGMGFDKHSPPNNNTIYHNYMDNTLRQVYTYGVNTWDNGIEGNYWSNYPDKDRNGDGIGDAPYVIDTNNKDNYPLVLVMVDQMFVSRDLCRVGSTETVAFHAKLHANARMGIPVTWSLHDSDIVRGTVYVNGTGYVTNGTGWISFSVTYDTPGKRVWTCQNCYQVVEDASITWVEAVPFWMQWWFWAIVAAGILVFAGAVYLLKKRKPPTPPSLSLGK